MTATHLTHRAVRRPARNRQAGLTLVEVSVSLAILITILVPLGVILSRSSASFASLAKKSHKTSRAPAVMDRLVGELMNARFVSLSPPIPNDSHWVRFEKVIGVQDGKPVYGNPVQIELVALDERIDDGIDNDGDGLIDEGAIRIWEDVSPHGLQPGGEDRPTVVASNLAKDGLRFTREGAFLRIDLTYEERTDKDRPTETVHLQSGVMLRNS